MARESPSSLRGSTSSLSNRASVRSIFAPGPETATPSSLSASEDEQSTPIAEDSIFDPIESLPRARSARFMNADLANDPNASPFATVSMQVGGAPRRWPWTLDSPVPSQGRESQASTSAKTVEATISVGLDPTFKALLRKRLGETKDQLAMPGLTRSVKWYLETEVRRIEGKLNEAGKEEVSGVKLPEEYTVPFCHFLTENPTIFHAVDYFEKKLTAAGYTKLSERASWATTLKKGGKYFVERNGSSMIAFIVGENYEAGNGVAMIAGHVDALTAKLKPVSTKPTAAGYVQLGVAPYGGSLNSTWWDRDLGIGGRVLVKNSRTGKIDTKLVKLGWPIAKIPSLAPHFGVGMLGANNPETQAVPIIGLDDSNSSETEDEYKNHTLGGTKTFVSTQPPKLTRAIAGELNITDLSSIFNWELELYDTEPAKVIGVEQEFISACRIDDKLCSWSAMEGLLCSTATSSSIIKLVGVFDDEEIGSLLRQGARGNFLPGTVSRVVETFTSSSSSSPTADILAQTYANSFLISADVTHAVNPNFLASYLPGHSPRLNVGLVVSADSNGHMTTDAVSTALLTRIAEKSDSTLQLFMIRNDSRSGGTVGPMLSAAMGVRAIDAGIPQLSMHSIRATTGALDPGLGVKIFAGFFEHFEVVDGEFE